MLSQPGEHLEPLEAAGAIKVSVPPLTDEELGQLSVRLGVMSGEASDVTPIPGHPTPVVDEDACNEFVSTLSRRSAGNALYATYLCREALRNPATIANPAETLLSAYLTLMDHLQITIDTFKLR